MFAALASSSGSPSRPSGNIGRTWTAFFIWVEKRYGLRNPCQDLGRWNPPDTLPRYYTREEIDRIAAAVLTDIERALIALILDNGLRIGEVASLLKSRIKDDL